VSNSVNLLGQDQFALPGFLQAVDLPLMPDQHGLLACEQASLSSTTFAAPAAVVRGAAAGDTAGLAGLGGRVLMLLGLWRFRAACLR
jgi:hypothetical protein